MRLLQIFVILSMFAIACKKDKQTASPNYTDPFTIVKNKVYNYNKPVQLIGANAFHVFGAGGSDMNGWNMDITREFVGNMSEQPLTGFAVQDANGAYLHSLQAVIDSNRANKRISIICPFGWNGTNATIFSGKTPNQTYWWNDFKIKLKEWAIHFKNQPDVWIEVWNEPYRYDRADGYTDDIWMNTMNELAGLIRNTGNNNIIVIPCAEQGQDETVLNNKGPLFLSNQKNILFDIHAYEKWLLVSGTDISNRLQRLKQNNLPVFFGETAPLNAGVLMNAKPFLDTVYNQGLSVCAWVWKYDANDKDALLTATGLPNNNNNNNWGTNFRTLCLSVRKP
jgi:mannan endo-1,4-beta-mannosidase